MKNKNYTENDNRILEKYNEMPNLRVRELDDDTKFSLMFVGIFFTVMIVGMSLLVYVSGYETPELKEYKLGIMENIKKMGTDDCEKLLLVDVLLSKHESLQGETRKAVNQRLLELGCL